MKERFKGVAATVKLYSCGFIAGLLMSGGRFRFPAPFKYCLHSGDRPFALALCTLQCKAYGLFCSRTDHEGCSCSLVPRRSLCCFPLHPQPCICYRAGWVDRGVCQEVSILGSVLSTG